MIFFPYIVGAVYNIQLAFDPKLNQERDPNFISIINGHALIGDLYVKRYDMKNIDSSDDKAIEKFLFDMYMEKVSF